MYIHADLECKQSTYCYKALLLKAPVNYCTKQTSIRNGNDEVTATPRTLHYCESMLKKTGKEQPVMYYGTGKLQPATHCPHFFRHPTYPVLAPLRVEYNVQVIAIHRRTLHGHAPKLNQIGIKSLIVAKAITVRIPIIRSTKDSYYECVQSVHFEGLAERPEYAHRTYIDSVPTRRQVAFNWVSPRVSSRADRPCICGKKHRNRKTKWDFV
ncbi:hypothetical protein ACRALDRAFT_1093605 [Sodiomyces alcalophilus JCM 7366]|uniref:uncharacterized protein n=1 Tax=Sodiomyces alcalophilus JCM 7366 TaxID=591952 RepID=UPI0039B6106D